MGFIALFFPGCMNKPKTDLVEKDKKCFYSAKQHLITALVVAILLAAGAAALAYFLTHGSFLYIAVAGGAGLGVTFLTQYVALRCIFGRRSEPIKNDPCYYDSIVDKPILSTEGGNKINPFPVEISDVGYVVKEAISLAQKDLPDLISQIDASFTETMKKKGIVYYDPSNELVIPLPRLYQSLLSHPEAEKKEKSTLIMQLFAKELDQVWETSCNKKEDIKSYIIYFDSKVILQIAQYTENIKVKEMLSEFTPNNKKSEIKKAMDWQIEISRQLREELKGDFYFGTALDDGGCFWHTMSQYLTHLLDKPVTEKTLRLQCIDYMKKLNLVESRKIEAVAPEKDKGKMKSWVANAFDSVADKTGVDYAMALEQGSLSSKEYSNNNENDLHAPLWGSFDIHGKIIAELYGINLVVLQTTDNVAEFKITREEEIICEEEIIDYYSDNESSIDDDDDEDGDDDNCSNNLGNMDRYCSSEVQNNNKKFFEENSYYIPSMPTTIKPYKDKDSITLGQNINETVYIVVSNQHFFPLWRP